MPDPTWPGLLGRRPTDPARLARTVRLQLTGAVPAHPLAADHLTGVPRWCLGANNRFGTCGPVNVANSAILTWHYLLGEDITVTDNAVFDLYRRSGNPTFDPAAPPDANGNVPGDKGVNMTVMLSALVKGGITITHPDGKTEIAKPLCFAAHPPGIEDVHAVTAIFGASLFALDLDVAQQAQTNTGLWDYVAGSPSWGGHATLGGAYTSAAGAGQRDATNITWTMRVGTTDAFLGHQLAEAYAIVWPALWTHPAFMAGVNQAALAAAFTAETGRPFPIPIPVPPPVVHADPADRALAPGLRAWLAAKNL